MLAAELGVHVLVEKPLAASLADCDAMIGAADRAGVKLGVISQRRWYEPARRVRAAIDAGKLGKPVLATVTMLGWRSKEYYESDSWRGTWADEGGGVLVNQAPHQLDLLLWYMGAVAEVSGMWANLNHPVYRGRGHRRRRHPLQEWGAGQHRRQQFAEPRLVWARPPARIEWRVGRRADRERIDVHRRDDEHRRAAAQRPLDDPRRGGAAR